MIPGNVIVCLVYIAIITIVLYFYKRSANNSTQTLANSQNVISQQSISLTISKYLLHRYTFLAIRHQDKKYVLAQLLSISVLSVTLLNLNRIMFYQIGTLPLSFILGMIINDIWMLKKKRQSQLEDVEGQVIVQPRWISMGSEQIIRASVVLIIVVMLSIAAYKVNFSLSNLGQINSLSVLIGFAVDQLAMRPILGLIIVGIFKAIQAVVGKENILQYKILRQITYQQYLRDPSNQNLSLEMIKLISQVKSCGQQKTSSPLKLPECVQRQSQNNSNQGTLADLLNRHSSICIEDKIEIKVEDISIIDQINKMEQNDSLPPPIFQDLTSKGTEQNDKQSQEQEVDLNILKQKNQNQDIYLANMWPPNQLQLPDSMDVSPKLKKRRINKKKRVLNLCGNSPYLQYLPNMLKKQQSQNKLKSLSKNNLQSKVLTGIENRK